MDKEGNQLKSASLSIEITGREDVIMTDAARLLGITSPPEPLPEPLKLFISLQADAEFSGGKWTYMSTGGGVDLSGSLAPFVGKKMSTGLKVLANAIVLYRGTILSSGAVQGTVSFGGFATVSQTIAGFNVSVNTRFFSNIPNQAYNFSIADLGPLATETEAGPEQGAPLAAPSYMAAPVTPSATTATQLVVTSARIPTRHGRQPLQPHGHRRRRLGDCGHFFYRRRQRLERWRSADFRPNLSHNSRSERGGHFLQTDP